MRVVVTGAEGRLGRALCSLGGARVVGLGRAALDIGNPEAVAAALARWQPVAVINAAAMANVDACEHDYGAALHANRDGPATLAAACAEAGVALVHVSTDYVFGADDLTRARREDDPPAPINAYGRSKLEGERAVLAAGGLSMIVRTAWLFGFANDFIDRMLRKAGLEGALEVTEQIGTPTPVQGLAGALLACAEHLQSGAAVPKLLHVAGNPITTRAAWVEEALAAGPARLRQVPVKRVGAGRFGDDAVRPAGTPLDTELFRSVFGGDLDWRPAVLAGIGEQDL
jgi:dTDP-4-dehydrorhamnose reductase